MVFVCYSSRETRRKFPIFAQVDVMKGIVLIISLFLSCAFSGTCAIHPISEGILHETVISSTDKNTSEKKVDFNDLAILPLRTVSYSGDGNNFAPSFRSSNSGRRVQPSTKFAFRLIKAGKVFDRNNFYSFQTVLLQFQSGIHSNGRYIHSICQLLI